MDNNNYNNININVEEILNERDNEDVPPRIWGGFNLGWVDNVQVVGNLVPPLIDGVYRNDLIDAEVPERYLVDLEVPEDDDYFPLIVPDYEPNLLPEIEMIEMIDPFNGITAGEVIERGEELLEKLLNEEKSCLLLCTLIVGLTHYV